MFIFLRNIKNSKSSYGKSNLKQAKETKVNPKATASGIYREYKEVRLWARKTYGQGLIPMALKLKT